MEIKRLIRLCLACLMVAAFATPAFAESEDAPLPGDYQVPQTSQPALTHHKAVQRVAAAKPSQASKMKKHAKSLKRTKLSHKGRAYAKKPAKSAKSRHVKHKPHHGKKHKRVKRKH